MHESLYLLCVEQRYVLQPELGIQNSHEPVSNNILNTCVCILTLGSVFNASQSVELTPMPTSP